MVADKSNQTDTTQALPNKPIAHARELAGINQKVAAECMGVSASVFSKYERGIKKPDQSSLDTYLNSLSMSTGCPLVYSKKGVAKGMIGHATITAVRPDKDNPDIVVVTSRFDVPARKGQPSKKVSWSVRVHRQYSPKAFDLAKAWKKPAKK